MFNKVNLVDIARNYIKIIDIDNEYAYSKCKCGGLMLFNKADNTFTCMQCSANGSVLEWVKHQFDVDIQTSYKWLRDHWHMREMNTLVCADIKKMQQLNADALRYFESALHRPVGQKALKYLKDTRHLTDEIIARFHMGCAVDSWDALKRHLLEAGYSENEIVNAGLISKSQKTLKTYDFFMDRAMFPFIDDNRIVGFGGRTLCNDKRKYLNSKKTLLFQKNEFLFGLNFVESDSVVVCEGNLDVITLHQYGFNNAIATCGTALSTAHIERLRRKGIKTMYLSFDADLAGQTAIIKAINKTRNSDINIKVICIPVGIAKDPDEYLQIKGADGFYGLIQRAISAEEFLVRHALPNYDISSSAGRQALLTELYSYGLTAKEFHKFLP